MKTPSIVSVFSILAALSWAGVAQAADDYVTNSDEVVKAADWEKKQEIVVVMDEFSYEPKDIVLKANQPYVLVLKNEGEKKHYYTAPDFFKAIATRKVETRDAEVKVPYLKALEVVNGSEAKLFMVPVKPGKYPVYCTIEDHKDKGMTGSITVD